VHRRLAFGANGIAYLGLRDLHEIAHIAAFLDREAAAAVRACGDVRDNQGHINRVSRASVAPAPTHVKRASPPKRPLHRTGKGSIEVRPPPGSELSIRVEGNTMCMYSVTAQNSRDARQGEDLVVTRAPHGSSNWLTEAGKPNIAVCVPNTAVLGVQLSDESTRGASFEQARVPDERGDRDFLVYLDGEKERVALSSLSVTTKVRVLHLFANTSPEVAAPRVLEAEHNEGKLFGAASGATVRPDVGVI
jgi:hypothetical protein